MRKVLLLILLSSGLQAQQIIVKDAETGNPITNLYIFCDSGSTLTNKDGIANLAALENCNILNFQHPSYESASLTVKKVRELNFQVYLSESFMNLNQVEVTFNKWEEDSREIPVEISRIEAKEIQFQNPQTAADLLGVSGEVFIQKSQLGGGSPMLRGFSTNRVLLVVDGVRMNTAIFREGNVQNVISIDPNTVSSAEVIFGPGSVIYGSDAIGGVMDFHTLTPQFSFNERSKLSINYLARTSSANNERTAHLHFNLGGKNWASLTSFTFTDYDDQVMGSRGPDDYLRTHYQDRVNGRDTILINPNPEEQIASGYSQINFMQKLRYRPLRELDINYGFHYSATTNVPRYDRLNLYGDRQRPLDTLRNAEWYYGPQVWIMNNLNATYNKSNRYFDRAQATIAHQFFEESRNDRRIFSNTLRSRVENVNALSFSFDFEKQLRTDSRLFYGLEYVHNKVSSSGERINIETEEANPTSSRYPDGSTWQYVATYANLKHEFNEKLIFNAGLRANYVALRGELDSDFFNFPFDDINQDNFAFNGSIGISYLADESLQLRANLSNGFRAPNVDDAAKVFDSGNGLVVVPNANLKPEFLYSFDAGLVKTFSDEARFEASGFISLLNNALVRRDFTFNGQDSIFYDDELSQVQALQNADEALVIGGQAAFWFVIIGDLESKSSVHYTWGETSDGQNLRHVAPLYGITHLYYRYKKLNADLYAVFNGEVSYQNLAPSERDKSEIYALDDAGNPYSPAWATLNFKAEYPFGPKFTLQAGVENILDVRYQPYSSGIAAPGRNFIIAVRGSF